MPVTCKIIPAGGGGRLEPARPPRSGARQHGDDDSDDNAYKIPTHVDKLESTSFGFYDHHLYRGRRFSACAAE